MRTRLIRLCAAVMVAALSGCATQTKMAFEDDKQVVAENGNPIYLMTVTVKNAYKPSYQPRLLVANIENPGATDAAHRFNFKMDEKSKIETDSLPSGNSYLLRVELAPGQYEIVGLTSLVQSFPFMGSYFTPIHVPIVAASGGVYYLGHVEATVRERQGNEFKAGPSVPLIDQAVVGASGGTFDVEITNSIATDEALFRTKFPALAKVEIRQSILPAFDRAKAQQWWETH